MNRQRRNSVKREDGGQRRSRSRSPRRNRGGHSNGSSGTNNRMVFITNIAYEVRWVELKTLVREKSGGEVVFCELLEDRNGKPKGNAVVEFETREAAENCVKNLQKYEWKGRNIIAKEIRDPEAFFRTIKKESGIDYLAKAGGSVPRGGAGGGASGGHKDVPDRLPRTGTYELFGLNMDFLRQLHIEPPLCERIFVANLPFNVGTDRIYAVFGMAGKITWMDYRLDKEGKSKGVCVVQYTHPIEAVQAVSMFNNQRFCERNLVVKMDRLEKIEKDHTDGGLPRGLESIGMGLGADGAPLANVSAVFGGSDAGSAPFSTPTATAAPAPFVGGGLSAISNGFSGLDSFGRLGNGGSYGSSSQSYQTSDLGFGGSGSRFIVIRNLPTDYTWQIVRDRVRQFGDVETVDMISAGVARVRFGSFQDAERARTSLFGTTVEGRVINVEYA